MSNGKEFEDLVWLDLLSCLNTLNSCLAQIMKIDHWQHVALIIRAQIDISEGKFDEDDPDVLQDLDPDSSDGFRNIILGARQKPLSFAAIESLHSENTAFKRFRQCFCTFLSIILPAKTVATYKSIFTEETTVC